jgi:HK97 family phage major capsid protein
MTMTKTDLEELRGLDAHRRADAELRARLAELDQLATGRPFTTEQRTEFETISGTDGLLDQVAASITELEIREAVIAKVVDGAPRGVEREQATTFGIPNVIKAPDNIFDLSAYRKRVRSIDDLPMAYRDGAMRALDITYFPGQLDQAAAKAHVASLFEPTKHRPAGKAARMVLATGDPAYLAAWEQYATRGLDALSHEQRNLMHAALQTYTDADGGVAIPFTIDPTFVLTSNGSVNPLRAIARKETITTKEWQAVATAGVTAAYKASETAAATDAAPSDFTNPTITPIGAHVLVKLQAEYQEDYGAGAIASEVGRLVQVAKDDLEADKFFMGSGTNEPDGIVARLITDTTSIVPTSTNDVFALGDIDKLIAAVPPRFRSRSEMCANMGILQLIPAFGTAGQPADSIYNPISKTLRGYAIHEASAMDAVATDAKEILLQGDFQYLVIVDRLGLTTEYIPQMFDTNGNPTGTRGIYCRWRNDTGLLSVNAFRLLRVQ